MARRNSSTSTEITETDQGQETPEAETQAQAPEHPESGEGNQAGSATGEETEHGAESGESDRGALTAEGEGATTSHVESVQRSGDLSGATGEIPPGSTGTRDPSPELAANLGQAEKTKMRTEQSVEDREVGEGRRTPRKAQNDRERLDELNELLKEANDDVTRACARRDEILTEHDRVSDRIASASERPFGQITADYFASSDKAAEEEAAMRRKLRESGLGSLLKA